MTEVELLMTPVPLLPNGSPDVLAYMSRSLFGTSVSWIAISVSYTWVTRLIATTVADRPPATVPPPTAAMYWWFAATAARYTRWLTPVCVIGWLGTRFLPAGSMPCSCTSQRPMPSGIARPLRLKLM